MDPETSPASRLVAAEARSAVRRHGLVLWLDADAHYTDLVDHLIAARARGELPYAVEAFRGSHLALLLALEHHATGPTPTPLLVHLPGFTRDAVRASPLFELYAAGHEHRKALATAVTEAAAGRVAPEAIDAFLAEARAAGDLTLARADAWLAAQLAGRPPSPFATTLAALTVPALLDVLLAGTLTPAEPDLPALWEHLAARTGLTRAWRDEVHLPAAPRPREIAFAVASWALSVEYVHDLRRPPHDARLTPLRSLPELVVEAARAVATHLRDRHPTVYQLVADDTEGWLDAEASAARAEDLGKIDTFRFEEQRVLDAALAAVSAEDWPSVLDWAHPRTHGGSFWVRSVERQSAWQLLHDAAALGRALSAAGTALQATSLEEAVERYERAGAAVDRAHRTLEQRRAKLLHPQLPQFEVLRACLDGMRLVWRRWADDWSRDFQRLCRSRGFLPPPHLQQRTLFDDVVRPLTQEAGPTALFLVDALRYEMGEELRDALDGAPDTAVSLRGRLAELPTVTAVGMNVLPPVTDQGRLRPSIRDGAVLGFAAREFRVYNHETRQRVMHDRVGGATCPWLPLEDVLRREATSLKQAVARARLVVVHSLEVDEAGESGAGLAVFDPVLQRLRSAMQLLREAGVRRFVVTSDHGFLLLDDLVVSRQAHGRKREVNPRWTLSPVAEDPVDVARVPLADLGYLDVDGHLLFPTTTALFDTGKRPIGFVHGGNTLQERVIPVLSVVHRGAAGADTLQYAVQAEAAEGVAGMHCILGRVGVRAQGALAFGGTRQIELGLRVVDGADVQVELCQVRGSAELRGGGIHAAVDAPFEVFFKLVGTTDARVQVALHAAATAAQVEPCTVTRRFDVTAGPRPRDPTPAPAPTRVPTDWLDGLPDGIRQVFAHLTQHGAVTEAEVAAMLGGQRQARRFARDFEQHAASAPYAVRIDVVAGVKRYVRQGSER